MSRANQPTRRILVGAGSFVDATAALRLAERLAADLSAALGGVLVEEVSTLAICELPNQRIVLVSGDVMRAPDRLQVRTLMQADARAFERCIRRQATMTGAECIFVQEVGDLVRTALRAAVGWDILVIGYRQVHAIPGKLILLQGDQAPSEGMTRAARVLTQWRAAEQVVFSVGRGGAQTADATPPGRYHFETLDAAMTALARTNAQAVLVDLARGPLRGLDDLARLLEVSRCPLIVFGASDPDALHAAATAPPSASDTRGHAEDR